MMEAAQTVVIPWSRTQTDGVPGLSPEHLRVGAEWRWEGGAVRLSPRAETLRLERPIGMETLRGKAAHRAVRMGGARKRIVEGPEPEPGGPEEIGPRKGFVLTDGHHSYGAAIGTSAHGEPLAIFDRGAPPEGAETWVVRSTLGGDVQRDGVICFTPGTRIRTEQGDVPAEMVTAGMRVITADNGPREVIWTGARRISGARLRAMPWLAPVLFRPGALGPEQTAPLLVSPRHKVLLRGMAATTLFGTGEVLVAAADLVDEVSVVRVRAREVTYIHILCERHELLWSGGVLTESFNPSPSALSLVEPAQREALLRVAPDAAEPGCYGPAVRRTLGAGEAAIMRAMA